MRIQEDTVLTAGHFPPPSPLLLALSYIPGHIHAFCELKACPRILPCMYVSRSYADVACHTTDRADLQEGEEEVVPASPGCRDSRSILIPSIRGHTQSKAEAEYGLGNVSYHGNVGAVLVSAPPLSSVIH